MSDKLVSRAEVMSGSLNYARRAAKLLNLVETRCLYMLQESWRVVAAYLFEGDENFHRRFEGWYLESLKLLSSSQGMLLLEQIERFAPQWKYLIPCDPELRARLLRSIEQKYGLGPSTFAALGGSEVNVQSAYRKLFSQLAEAPVTVPVVSTESYPAQSYGEAPQDVETRLEWLNQASGEVLYQAGDPGDALYVVISGRLRLNVKRIDGSEHLVRQMGRGELIGELESSDRRCARGRPYRQSAIVSWCALAAMICLPCLNATWK